MGDELKVIINSSIAIHHWAKANVQEQKMGISPSSPGNSVQVCVSVLRHVVVEDNVDSLNVHATAE